MATGPAVLTWHLPAYAPHWLSDAELTAVTTWMAANDMRRVTEQAPVDVANGQITFGQDRSPATAVRAAHREIVTVTRPLRTPPPEITTSCSPDQLPRLQAVLAEHEWSAGFDGVCIDCSGAYADSLGHVWCHRAAAVPWPCPPVRAALVAAGFAVAHGTSSRVLGDCLDPVDNARAGLAVPQRSATRNG